MPASIQTDSSTLLEAAVSPSATPSPTWRLWPLLSLRSRLSSSPKRCKLTPTWRMPSALAASYAKDLTSAETWLASTTSAGPAGSSSMGPAFPTTDLSWGTRGAVATWTGLWSRSWACSHLQPTDFRRKSLRGDSCETCYNFRELFDILVVPWRSTLYTSCNIHGISFNLANAQHFVQLLNQVANEREQLKCKWF